MLKTAVRGVAASMLALATMSTAWAADASGKWTWTRKIQDREITQTLELKQNGEKLAGSISGPSGQKTEIRDGTVKGSDIAFTVVRERNGQEFKIRYSGKLDGDTIQGKQVMTRNGEERSFDWEAKRVK